MNNIYIKNKYYTYLIVLILAAESIYILPYVLARVFRPTFLDVFDLTNLELGTLFSTYGIVAFLSYLYGGILADKYSPRKLLSVSLILTSFGGVIMMTYPSYTVMQLLFAYWGFTTVFLFWAPMIKATRMIGGQKKQGKTFSFLDGAPDDLPEPVSDGIDLSFGQRADKPESIIALVGGQIVTMRDADNNREIIDQGTVLVESNRIVAVGPVEEVKVPANARKIDVTGKVLVPGFIDAHAHGSQARSEIIPQQNWKNISSLAFGVTTIHDPSNDSSEIFSASEMQRAGHILGPRIFSTGTILYGANSPRAFAGINSYEDALFHLKRLKDMGAVSVKSYTQPRREQRQQVLKAARELGLMVENLDESVLEELRRLQVRVPEAPAPDPDVPTVDVVEPEAVGGTMGIDMPNKTWGVFR